MFGIKFRSWMEAHLVRPRKKPRTPKEGSGTKNTKTKNGKIVPDATQHDNSRVFTNAPVLRKTNDTPEVVRCSVNSIVHSSGCSTMEPIALSTLHHDSYPAPVNNLSSPESAYSTGYSTDGTSPGAGAPFTPPEYYINIRTGTHYFLPNSANNHGNPSSAIHPQIVTPPQKKPPNSVHFASSSPVPNRVFDSNTRTSAYHVSAPVVPGCIARQYPPSYENTYGYTFKNQAAFKASPKIVSAVAVEHQRSYGHNHRRTESCDESRRLRSTFDLHDTPPVAPLPRQTPTPPPAPPPTNSQLTASPRQRTRIRTNPWLTANPSNATMQTGTNSSNSSIYKASKSRTSSGYGFKNGIEESNSSHGSVSDKTSSRQKSGPKDFDGDSMCSLSSTSSCHSISTDDDLTLNEMMGKFDESYVYEKETDILSDSDPTDCDETDFEAGQEGDNERDTQDDELDFIDKGSLLELPVDLSVDSSFNATNKGHCTYHDFVRKPRYRESVYRRNNSRSKEDKASPVLKRGSIRKEHCPSRSTRDGSKSRKQDSSSGSCQNNCRGLNEKKKIRNVVHKSVRERNLQSKNRLDNTLVIDKINIGEAGSGSVLSFKHILLQKMLSRENAVGTRSAGSTPVSSRRKVFTKEVYSPKKTLNTYSNAVLNMNRERNADDSFVNNDVHKRRSNSVCYARSGSEMCRGSKYSSTYASELALIEADKEADLKYKQLIMEAETILTTMKDQIPAGPLKHIPKPNFFTRKADLGSVYLSPNMGRKDYSKKIYNKDVPILKHDLKPEPPFVNRAQVCSPSLSVTENHSSPSMSGNDSGEELAMLDTTSDGSITPHQEDFDDPPIQMLRTSNQRFATQVDTHSSDECTDPQFRCPGFKLDGKSSYKSTKERRCYKSSERKDIALATVKSLNDPKIFEEINVRQEIDVHKTRYDKMVYRKVTTPLLERRLNIIKTSECVANRDPSSRRSFDECASSDLKVNATKLTKSPSTIGVGRPQLVAFRSVDLGNELDDSSYCPQSEPVKRKVYTCSASFDRLQKSLAEKGKLGAAVRDPGHDPDNSRNSLREKLERLRRERDEKDENNINELSPAHHSDTAHKLSLIRRQMLVNTIEGLKRSLEDQSAKLQATYSTQDPANTLQLKNS